MNIVWTTWFFLITSGAELILSYLVWREVRLMRQAEDRAEMYRYYQREDLERSDPGPVPMPYSFKYFPTVPPTVPVVYGQHNPVVDPEPKLTPELKQRITDIVGSR